MAYLTFPLSPSLTPYLTPYLAPPSSSHISPHHSPSHPRSHRPPTPSHPPSHPPSHSPLTPLSPPPLTPLSPPPSHPSGGHRQCVSALSSHRRLLPPSASHPLSPPVHPLSHPSGGHRQCVSALSAHRRLLPPAASRRCGERRPPPLAASLSRVGVGQRARQRGVGLPGGGSGGGGGDDAGDERVEPLVVGRQRRRLGSQHGERETHERGAREDALRRPEAGVDRGRAARLRRRGRRPAARPPAEAAGGVRGDAAVGGRRQRRRHDDRRAGGVQPDQGAQRAVSRVRGDPHATADGVVRRLEVSARGGDVAELELNCRPIILGAQNGTRTRKPLAYRASSCT